MSGTPVLVRRLKNGSMAALRSPFYCANRKTLVICKCCYFATTYCEYDVAIASLGLGPEHATYGKQVGHDCTACYYY